MAAERIGKVARFDKIDAAPVEERGEFINHVEIFFQCLDFVAGSHFDEDIHVAVGAEVIAEDGAEEGELDDAVAAAEGGEGGFVDGDGKSSHGSPGGIIAGVGLKLDEVAFRVLDGRRGRR